MKIMMFPKDKSSLDAQYQNIKWITESGESYAELEAAAARIAEDTALPKAIRKARIFEYLLTHGQLAVDAEDPFRSKLNAEGIMSIWRSQWEEAVLSEKMPELVRERNTAGAACAYSANTDFGHISPNTEALLSLGYPGMLARVRTEKARVTKEHPETATFYESCEITLSAVIRFLLRLAEAARKDGPAEGEGLGHLGVGAPQNTYEALEMIYLNYSLHERIAGGRVRTLGRLDASLDPFVRADLAAGTFTWEDIRQLFAFFLNKIWAAKVPFDQPLMLGGSDGNGKETWEELTEMIVDVYDSLSIHSPKLHIRVSDQTFEKLLLRILRCIRGGNSSILLLNEKKAMESLQRIGIDPEDAKKVILIGCYEAAVEGVEIPCTGNGSVNLPKALTYVFTRGYDPETGAQIGLDTGVPETFEACADAVKVQIAHLSGRAMAFIRTCEPLYPEIYPDPYLSSQMEHCVRTGRDAYSGGAKYNNSSLNAMGIATLTDSILAVRRLVYEEKRLSLSEFGDILKNDWKDREELRTEILRLPEKYGNADPEADKIACEYASFFASCVTGKPNGRGGMFKAGLYSIDHCFTFGRKTMATPDGRHAGDELSKNLCAVTAMDREGITALIRSVAAFDHAAFANGTILDYVLHPATVAGEDGLCVMLGLVKTYFALGGFAMHGNIFSTEVLRDAQAHPDKYQTLQVRLCGWNVFFVNLTKQEQDSFIAQCAANRE